MGFYDTVGGRRFVDGVVPRLVEALERVAEALEKANELKAREVFPMVEVEPDGKAEADEKDAKGS